MYLSMYVEILAIFFIYCLYICMYVCMYVGVLVDDENDFDDMQQGSGSASPIHTHNNEMSTAQSPHRGLDELGGSGSHMDNKECVCAVCQRVLGKAMKTIIFILVYRCMYVGRYAEFYIVCMYVFTEKVCHN
jgi:hypothetical protein